MSQLDDARARVAHLEEHGRLAQAIEDAAAAHRADPTDENLAVHDAACVAMCDHRAKARGTGTVVGGDAFQVPPGEPAPAVSEAAE